MKRRFTENICGPLLLFCLEQSRNGGFIIFDIIVKYVHEQY